MCAINGGYLIDLSGGSRSSSGLKDVEDHGPCARMDACESPMFGAVCPRT
jgi:hypothetical protein